MIPPSCDARFDQPAVSENRGSRAQSTGEHVHVWSAGGEVVIDLAVGTKPQTIRSVAGMRTADIAAAFHLVERHTAHLLQCWRKHHD